MNSIYPRKVSMRRAIKNAASMGTPQTLGERLLERAYQLIAEAGMLESAKTKGGGCVLRLREEVSEGRIGEVLP